MATLVAAVREAVLEEATQQVYDSIRMDIDTNKDEIKDLKLLSWKRNSRVQSQS